MTKVLGFSIASCTEFFLLCALAGAQNPPQPPQTIPSWAAAPQASKGDQQNFPPLLLEQLSAIKAAALNDDYAYRELS
jgi:hypothetical protein